MAGRPALIFFQRNTGPYTGQSNNPLPETQWFLKDYPQQQCQEYWRVSKNTFQGVIIEMSQPVILYFFVYVLCLVHVLCVVHSL